ncbi:hypothetical protein SDJN02_17845, partial [Cucurbita argyrosperma subsp. argyrosperma]
MSTPVLVRYINRYAIFSHCLSLLHLQVLKSSIEEVHNNRKRKSITATTKKLWHKVGGTHNIRFHCRFGNTLRRCIYFSPFAWTLQIRFCGGSKLATRCKDSNLSILFTDTAGSTREDDSCCPLSTCEMSPKPLLTPIWHEPSCNGTAPSANASEGLLSNEEMPTEVISDMAWNIGLPITKDTKALDKELYRIDT